QVRARGVAVQIDEAGRQPARSEVEHVVARGHADLLARADRLDLAVLDQHHAVIDELRAVVWNRQDLLGEQREARAAGAAGVDLLDRGQRENDRTEHHGASTSSPLTQVRTTLVAGSSGAPSSRSTSASSPVTRRPTRAEIVIISAASAVSARSAPSGLMPFATAW